MIGGHSRKYSWKIVFPQPHFFGGFLDNFFLIFFDTCLTSECLLPASNDKILILITHFSDKQISPEKCFKTMLIVQCEEQHLS